MSVIAATVGYTLEWSVKMAQRGVGERETAKRNIRQTEDSNLMKSVQDAQSTYIMIAQRGGLERERTGERNKRRTEDQNLMKSVQDAQSDKDWWERDRTEQKRENISSENLEREK